MTAARLFLIAFGVCGVTAAFASENLTPEPAGSGYHYASHYRAELAAPPAVAWPFVADLAAWMGQVEMALLEGSVGEPGAVYRLYPNQDFLVQVIAADPPHLLVIANLPSEFRGEASTGFAVITLAPVGESTILDLTLARRYEWLGDGDNPQRATRESSQFQAQTAGAWAGFLARLAGQVESATAVP